MAVIWAGDEDATTAPNGVSALAGNAGKERARTI
jgi:hypothetical protein